MAPRARPRCGTAFTARARPRASRAPPPRMPPDLSGRGRFARRAHKSQIAKSKRPAGIGRGIVQPSFALAVPRRGARAGSPGKRGGSGSEKKTQTGGSVIISQSAAKDGARRPQRARGAGAAAQRGGRDGEHAGGGEEGPRRRSLPRRGGRAPALPARRRRGEWAEGATVRGVRSGVCLCAFASSGPTKKKEKRVGEPERGGNDAGSHSGAPAAAQLAAPTPSRHGSALARARKSRTAARGRAVRRRAKWWPCLRSG